MSTEQEQIERERYNAEAAADYYAHCEHTGCDALPSSSVSPDPWKSLFDRIQSRAMVAGQCSVEEPDNPRASMAAAEAEFLSAVADQIAAARAADDARHQRLLDLVRYSRADLHEAGLISNEEYAALVDVDGSPQRLEGYDAIRVKLSTAEATIREKDAALAVMGQMVSEHETTRLSDALRAAEATIASLTAQNDAPAQEVADLRGKIAGEREC